MEVRTDKKMLKAFFRGRKASENNVVFKKL